MKKFDENPVWDGEVFSGIPQDKIYKPVVRPVDDIYADIRSVPGGHWSRERSMKKEGGLLISGKISKV